MGVHDLYENTVRFEETDAQGIVFYGNWATFQDETFTAYMAAVGFPYDDLRARSWDVHVVNMELNYHAPAEFRDDIVNAARIATISESSMTFEYEARLADDDEVLVDGTVTHVAVDDEGRPRRVPDEFRRAVVDFQDDPPAMG